MAKRVEPVEDILSVELPDDHWSLLVSVQVKQEGKPNSWTINSLHPVARNGVLACDCEVSPVTSEMYRTADVHPHWREKIICSKGKRYLRAALSRENGSGESGRVT